MVNVMFFEFVARYAYEVIELFIHLAVAHAIFHQPALLLCIAHVAGSSLQFLEGSSSLFSVLCQFLCTAKYGTETIIIQLGC